MLWKQSSRLVKFLFLLISIFHFHNIQTTLAIPANVCCGDHKCQESIGNVKLVKTYSGQNNVRVIKDDVVKLIARSDQEWKIQLPDLRYVYIDHSYFKELNELTPISRLVCITNPEVSNVKPNITPNHDNHIPVEPLIKSDSDKGDVPEQNEKKLESVNENLNAKLGMEDNIKENKNVKNIKNDGNLSTESQSSKSNDSEIENRNNNIPDKKIDEKKVVDDKSNDLPKKEVNKKDSLRVEESTNGEMTTDAVPNKVKSNDDLRINSNKATTSSKPVAEEEKLNSPTQAGDNMQTNIKTHEDPDNVSKTPQRDVSEVTKSNDNVPTVSDSQDDVIGITPPRETDESIEEEKKENDEIVVENPKLIKKHTTIKEEEISKPAKDESRVQDEDSSNIEKAEYDDIGDNAVGKPPANKIVAVASQNAHNGKHSPKRFEVEAEKNQENSIASEIQPEKSIPVKESYQKKSFHPTNLMQCISDAASRVSSPRTSDNKVAYSPLSKGFIYILRINTMVKDNILQIIPSYAISSLEYISDTICGINHHVLLIWMCFIIEILFVSYFISFIKSLIFTTDMCAQKASSEDLKAMNIKFGEIQSRYLETENVNSGLLSAKQKLTEDYAEVSDRCSKLEKELKDLANEKQEMTAELESAMKTHDIDKSNAEVVEKLNETISVKETEITEMKNSHDQLATKLTELQQSSTQEIEKLKLNLTQSNDEIIRSMQQDYESATKNLNEKELVISQLRIELEEKQSQVETYYKDMLQMQSDIESNNKSRSEFEKQICDRDSELQTLRESFMQLKNLENSILTSQNSCVGNRNNKRKRRVKKLVPQLPVMKEEMVETEEEVEMTDNEHSSDDEVSWAKKPSQSNGFPDDDEDGDGWDVEDDMYESSKGKKTKVVKVKKMKKVCVPVEQPPLEVSTSEEEDENHDDSQEQQLLELQAKLTEFLDVAKLRSEINIEKEKVIISETQAKRELDLRKEIEARLTSLEEELFQRQSEYDRANAEKQAAFNKLEILSSYFKEREVELQKNLGKQVMVQSDTSDEMQMYKEKCGHMDTEIKVLKDQITSLKREMLDTEKTCRRQVTEFDKRSHENWLATRKAESLVKELRDENIALRQRLQESQRHAVSRALHGGTPVSGLFQPMPPPPPPPMGMGLDSAVLPTASGSLRRPKSRQSASNRSDHSSPAQSVFGSGATANGLRMSNNGGALFPPPPPPPMMPFAGTGIPSPDRPQVVTNRKQKR